MLTPFLKSKKNVLFICQLSDNFVKIVKRSFSSSKKGYSWELEFFPIPTDLEDNKLFAKTEEIFRRLKYNGEEIIVSLSRLNVTSRYLKVPASSSEEIEKIVTLQASRLFPYPANELACGFQVIGLDTAGFSEVNIIIVHRAIVERFLQLCKQLKASKVSVVLSSWGLRNLYYFLQPQEKSSLFLIDMDSELSEIVVLENQGLIFSRSFRVNSNQDNQIEQLREEFRNTLEVFSREVGRQVPAKIVFLQSGETISKVAEALGQEKGFDLISLEYLKNFEFPFGYPKGHSGLSCSFASLIGLGLGDIPENFNFLPAPLKQLHRGIYQRRQLLRHLFKMAILVLLFILATTLHLHNKVAYLAILKNKLKELAQETSTLEEIEKRLQILQRHSLSRISPLEALADMHLAIPQGISITTFVFEDDKEILIRGQSMQMNAVFSFVEGLQKTPAFKKFQVKVRYATKKKTTRAEVVDFEIICQRLS